jgi:CBS-domain-containing membrane protein
LIEINAGASASNTDDDERGFPMKQLTAADVMQNDVLSVNVDATIVDAARAMLRNKISGLPVIDWRRKMVGIVTEGDLLRRSEIGTERHRSRWFQLLLGPGRSAADYTVEHARKISEIMTENLVAVAADTPLTDVVAAMEQHHIKRVPVLDGDKLIGIVSRADLLRALVDASTPAAPGAVDDAQLRDAILKAIDRQEWSPRATINVDVKNAVVELRGCITDERERAALVVLAENTPGVRHVTDHLIWIEPLSGMVIAPTDLADAPTSEPTKR